MSRPTHRQWMVRACWTANAALAVFVFSAVANADTPAERASLKGLNGVRLIVDSVPPDVAEYGLRAADLQAEIEAQLKAASIPLIPTEERSLGNPTLHLSLSIFADGGADEPVITYWRQLSLSQEARLTRAPTARVTAITWQAPGMLATVSVAGLKRLRQDVRQDIERFVAAFREANRP